MEKKLLEEKIQSGATLKQMSRELNSSQTNVAYWIKKHSLKLRRGRGGKLPDDLKTPCKCACGESDPNKFYGHKHSICGKCHNKYNHENGRKKRQYILNKMGNKCQNSQCGFDKYKSALDVHHLDPSQKDVAFRTHRYWTIDRINKELEQCVLLCRNCHQAYHCGELELNFYRGVA